MPREVTAKPKKKRGFGGLFKHRSSKTSILADAAKVQTLEETNKKTYVDLPKSPSHSLPVEVKVSDGSPGQVSAISNTTGLDTEPQFHPTKLSSLLPPLTTDGDTVEGSLFGSSSKSSKNSNGNREKPKRSRHFMKNYRSSYFSRSKYFRRLSDWAFNKIDTDGSGQIDKKELYSGLLLIHLNLAVFAGPAACKPADREYVNSIFEKMDDDESGYLDKDEFIDVMTVLSSQVLTRVVLQWSMTIMIVPLISQYLLLGIKTLGIFLRALWKEIDELEPVTEYIMYLVNKNLSILTQYTPSWIKSVVQICCGLWNKIPESILLTIPVTIVSCILGSIAVPWMMYNVEDYFTRMAERKKQKRAVTKAKKNS